MDKPDDFTIPTPPTGKPKKGMFDDLPKDVDRNQLDAGREVINNFPYPTDDDHVRKIDDAIRQLQMDMIGKNGITVFEFCKGLVVATIASQIAMDAAIKQLKRKHDQEGEQDYD